MSTYPRMKGKRGKKLKEKRRKEKLRRQLSGGGSNINTGGFMGLEYEDSVMVPGITDVNSSDEDRREEKEDYSKSSLKKYKKIGTEVIHNFYQKDTNDAMDEDEEDEESSKEEEENHDAPMFFIDKTPDKLPFDDDKSDDDELESDKESEENDEDSEESSDEMPLPMFLLNREDVEFDPLHSYQNTVEPPESDPKQDHKTRKLLAKTKEKGIFRAFNFLTNNNFMQSFSFIPIPVTEKRIRNTINDFCEKFDLLMSTRTKGQYWFITVSKPAKWTQKNIKAAAKDKQRIASQLLRASSMEEETGTYVPEPVHPGTSAAKTLMEGLSTPIDESNKGNELLRKMGWVGGGLGKEGDGIRDPVQIHIKRDNKGIGAGERTSGKTMNSEMSFVRSTKE